MRKRTAAGAGRGAPVGLRPIPARHPAMFIVALSSAAIVTLAMTYRLTTPDFWQHLLVGKAIWSLGRVPGEHLWTWASYGQREVLPSWAFCWLLWPFWLAGGVLGLQVWRWLTTLSAYALAWSTARRLGARGLAPLVVIAVAALSYRARAQVRPETLVAVLLALELKLLERLRARRGGALALLLVAWVWANVHISYFVGLALIAFLAVTPRRPAARAATPAARATAPATRATAPEARGLREWIARADDMPVPLLLALAAAVSFANPFGWRALEQPLEYFLVWRHEPIYKTIPELTPLLSTWRASLRSGLPVLVVAWPLAIVARAIARRFDRFEALTCAFITALALFNQRFVGFLMVANVPYLSRALSEFAGSLRWPAGIARPLPRAALACGLMGLASLPSWTDPRFHFGIGYLPTLYPGRACEFLATHGLSGRMFNPYYFGGYIAWRFWPDRARLPFMDIHQSGTRRDRELYSYCFTDPQAWADLMREHDFQLALLDGHQEWVRGDRLPDILDADRGWALVFRDDAAALYVRRDGPLAAFADSFAYRVMPGGNEGVAAMGDRIASDSLLRKSLRAELERRRSGSPLNAQANSLLADLDFIEGDRAGARAHLLAANAVDPTLTGVHRRLGYLLMAEGRFRDAIREFEAEHLSGSAPEDELLRMGEAWERLGEPRRAGQAYRRELEAHPGDDAARAALRRLSASP